MNNHSFLKLILKYFKMMSSTSLNDNKSIHIIIFCNHYISIDNHDEVFYVVVNICFHVVSS